MFGLGRLNVVPVGDLGIANSIGTFYGDGSQGECSIHHRCRETLESLQVRSILVLLARPRFVSPRNAKGFTYP